MKIRPVPTKVRVFCTESHRSIKAKVLHQDLSTLRIEMPTGYIMKLEKKTKPIGCYYFRIGDLEFTTDGVLIN